MKKKEKVLYTLSKDGEVISGKVVKQVNNKTMLDLGDLEALIIRKDIDVFETEQEAINEQNNQDFDGILDIIENTISDVDAIDSDVEMLQEIVSELGKQNKLYNLVIMDFQSRIQKLEKRKWWQ